MYSPTTVAHPCAKWWASTPTLQESSARIAGSPRSQALMEHGRLACVRWFSGERPGHRRDACATLLDLHICRYSLSGCARHRRRFPQIIYTSAFSEYNFTPFSPTLDNRSATLCRPPGGTRRGDRSARGLRAKPRLDRRGWGTVSSSVAIFSPP